MSFLRAKVRHVADRIADQIPDQFADQIADQIASRRLRAIVALGALLCLGVGCDSAPDDPLEHAARSIRAQHIDAYGAHLSSDAMAGRYYASPEADSAASFIVRSLAELGIQPIEHADALLRARPASFAHVFSVFLYRLSRDNRLAVQEGTETRAARLGADYLPLLFSGDAQLTAPLLRLERPFEELTRAARARFRDRIAVVDGTALGARPGEQLETTLHRVTRALADAGVAAVLFSEVEDWLRLDGVTYPSQLPPEQQRAAQSSAGLRRNLHPDRLCIGAQARVWRQGLERTIPALVLRPGWGRSLRDGDEVGVQVELIPEVSLAQNVLVGFGGRPHTGELVILSAHYDNSGINPMGEILNGADDNASGVAALLEIARALALVQVNLQRSVLLAFVSAELQGIQGGEMLLADLPLLLDAPRPTTLIALDAVGRNGDDLVHVVAGNQHEELVRLLEYHNRREELRAPALLLEPLPSVPASAPGSRAALGFHHESTQMLFEHAGIPSVALNDGLDPLRYGQPDDDWHQVDSRKVARVARLVFLTTYDLATRAQATAVPARH